MRVTERLNYSLEHAAGIRKRLVVPEAKHSIALRFEECRASRVRVALHAVLSAVQLDDELRLGTAEVGDEWVDCMLAPELEAPETAVTQRGP